MSDYFDLLEAELRAAVPRAVRTRAPARRRIHLGNGAAPALFGAAVALAVVVIAVLLVGHDKRTPQLAPSKPNPATASAVPTLRELLDNFVILRRPQTAADRAWQPTLGPAFGVRKLPRLTRLARTFPNGDRVFLTVDQFRVTELGQAAGTYSMNVWMVSPSGTSVGTAYGPGGSYTIFPTPFASGGTPTHPVAGYLWMSVVPDGVGAVRWRFACSGPAARCTHAPVTLTVAVRNNVAVATVPGTRPCRAPAARCLQAATVVWYSSFNQVVARYSFARAGAITAPPFVLKPARPPVNGVPPRPANEMLSAPGSLR